jgi:glutaredoxin
MHFYGATERQTRGLGQGVLTGRAARRLFAPLMELKLYSREWCSWCIDAKEYLEARGYKFTEIDVGEDRQAYEEMKRLSEQTYVPTFVAGQHVLANFDTDQLEKFLIQHQITS